MFESHVFFFFFLVFVGRKCRFFFLGSTGVFNVYGGEFVCPHTCSCAVES